MSVITTCSILTGDAPIRVEWYKDSAPLDLASLNIHRNEMGDLGSSLVFRSVGPAHAGNYTCLARNRAGEDSFTAPMIVKGVHFTFLLFPLVFDVVNLRSLNLFSADQSSL